MRSRLMSRLMSRWERGFAIGLGVLLLALALAAQLFQSGSDSAPGSVASAEPGGRRALCLLLRDVGFRAEAWSDAPGALPREGALLWLAKTPASKLGEIELPKASEEKEKKEEDPDAQPPTASADEEGGDGGTQSTVPPRTSPSDLGLRSPSHYRRFVEEGGTLLLPESDRARKFLVDALGLTACGDVHASRVSKAGVRKISGDGGPGEGEEELEVEVREGGVLLLPENGSIARSLWRGGTLDAEGDDVLAMDVPVGRGRVVLLGDDGFLDNARIGERDHALFAVRLAEELAPGKRALFDEYALGLWQPRTPIAILASPGLFLASLHLVLLLLLLVLRSAWVREFPRDPAPLESASPILRARTLAALLARAGRHDLLAKLLRDGMSRRLDRRARATTSKIGSLPTKVASLRDAPCRSAEDLERLHGQLAAIERDAG